MTPRRLATTAALLLVPLAVRAQQGAPSATLTPAIRSAVIDAAIDRVGRMYVDADTGRLIGETLRTKLRAGAYDGLDNPAQFGEMVTRDLRAVNGDLHLSLRYTPPAPGATGPRAMNPVGNDPRLINFGLGRLEILDGNVGYLEITGFAGAPGYEDVVGNALKFLGRTDAIIIDVRRNGGGSGEMSHLVFSHFLGDTPVPTIRVKTRQSPEGSVRQSVAAVPGPRRPTVPLYVLTSQATGSAAEEFTFVLKNKHRATIVGTRTAGAGHMVNFVPAGNNFVLGLSVTRVSDPETGLEWERVGVQPDIAVPADRALTEAHANALKAIIAAGSTDGSRTHVLVRLLAALEARRNAIPVDASRAARFAGNYEGRVVTVNNGRLFYARRDGGLGEELVPLGGDRFALGATQFLFDEPDGKPRLTVEQADGTQVTFMKGGG